MNSRIFNYLDYIKWIHQAIRENKSVFGYKAKLAEAAGCQRSYFSLVLREKSHLTLEHALGLAQFWRMTESERNYFLDLVNLGRAANQPLRDYYKQKLLKLRTEQENFAQRFLETQPLSNEFTAIFYSQWYYLAVMMALTIPSLRNPSALADRLKLDESTIIKVLQQLIDLGLAVKNGNQFFPTRTKLHLPKESHFNSLNHAHWRTKAVENSFLNRDGDIHYSSVCTLSRDDIEKIKQIILQSIDASREIIEPSKEEDLYCLNIDWFRL